MKGEHFNVNLYLKKVLFPLAGFREGHDTNFEGFNSILYFSKLIYK